MKFAVIYSIDVPRGIKISQFAPPNVYKLWKKTEGDDLYEYDYLEDEFAKGHHRKWCAILTKKQFNKFVDHCRLLAEDVEIMGSFGFPSLGVSPAISFRSYDEDAIKSAYVTPLPETRKTELTDLDWKRVRKATLSIYG
jgi:hypothetical protein